MPRKTGTSTRNTFTRATSLWLLTYPIRFGQLGLFFFVLLLLLLRVCVQYPWHDRRDISKVNDQTKVLFFFLFLGILLWRTFLFLQVFFFFSFLKGLLCFVL